MATNKRKEAAALFELIDKSTLKIPKGGSLKIPNWWSSKTNPPPAPPEDPAKSPPQSAPSPAPNGHAVSVRAADAPSVKVITSPLPAATETPIAPAQSRLFEPPPASRPPTAPPSIRPPSASVKPPLTPNVKAPAPASSAAKTNPAAASPADAARPSLASTAASPLPGYQRDTQSRFSASNAVAAPGQPSAGARSPWSPPRPGAFARLPTWIIVTMVAGLFIVGALIIWMAKHRDARPVAQSSTSSNIQQTPPQPSGNNLSPLRGGSILPPPVSDVQPGPLNIGPSPALNINPNGQQPPLTQQVGHFYGPGVASRTADKFYIIIASTQSSTVAEKNGRFLASYGVDVSMETHDIGKNRWYVLMSVDGFSSHEAAEPLRKKAVDIGHELPEYKKHARNPSGYAWDDAYVVNGWKTGPATPPPPGSGR